MSAQWPAMEEGVDEILLKEVEYLKTVSHKFRVCLKKWKSKVCALIYTSSKSIIELYTCAIAIEEIKIEYCYPSS